MKINELSQVPELTPPTDPQLGVLLRGVTHGTTAVYVANVPVRLFMPFSPGFRPDRHKIGSQAVAAFVAELREGREIPGMCVYQRGAKFVVSDDYLQLFAYLLAKSEYAPCCILGTPDCDALQDLQGPFEPLEARRLIFGV